MPTKDSRGKVKLNSILIEQLKSKGKWEEYISKKLEKLFASISSSTSDLNDKLNLEPSQSDI